MLILCYSVHMKRTFYLLTLIAAMLTGTACTSAAPKPVVVKTQHDVYLDMCKAQVDKWWKPAVIDPSYSPEVQRQIKNVHDANREDLINVCVHEQEYK